MKSPKKNGIGEVVTDYGRRVMRIFKKGLLQRSLFDFYGDIKADTVKVKESSSVPNTPVDGDGGVVYVKSTDGKLYFKSNEVSEVELSSQGTNTTYSVSCVDGDNSDEEKIRLTGSDSSTDDVVLEAGTGLSIARDGDKITFTNTITDTDTVLTTEQVQDIAGALVATGGTKTGITVTYDDVNNNMDFVVGTDITLTTAAQPNITSLGTLTSLNVDNTNIDGSRITLVGSTDDACVIDCSTHGATTITTTDAAGAAADLGFIADGAITATSTSFTATTDDFTITSATANKPIVSIVSTNTGNKPPLLIFQKTDTGAALDSPGIIEFKADDDANNEHTYASIQSQIVSAANSSEAGKLSIEVATSAGSGTSNKNGILFTGSATANDVDVTIGAETTSLTTISGNLQVNGNEIKDDDGTTCLTFDSSGNVTTGGNLTCTTSSSLAGLALTLNHTSATGSPFIAFSQNGTRRSFIQHHNTDDKFRFASEFGALSLEAASSAGTDSNTAYLVIDPGGTFTLGAENSDVVLTTDGNMTFRVDADNDETNGSFIFQHNASTQIASITEDGTFSTSGAVVSTLGHKYIKTGNTDGTYQGDVVYFGGTTSMTTGRIYYYNSSGNWILADADSASTSSGLLGVALGAASDTNGVLLRGMVTLNHDPGAVGDILYLAPAGGVLANAGMASSTAPSGSGDIIRILGYCLDASNGQMWFNPDSTFVEYTT